MKEKRSQYVSALINRLAVFFVLVAVVAASVHAQSVANEPDAGQKRLKRARALVAAHQLEAAASELTAIRNTTTDDSVRDVARIMLMSIFLEEADYMRAQSLLEETYGKLRSAQDENSTRTYFALAGQAVNGSREHFSRYRSFGINVTDKEMPSEAVSDLDHMRMLLERVADQARELSGQDEKSFDALGLLEEAASMRGTLARNNQERLKWQREVSDTRQRLAASETRIAALSTAPVRSVAPAPAASTAPTPSSSSASPNHSINTNAKKTATPDSRPQPSAPQANASTDEPAAAAALPAPNGKPMDVGSLIDKATQKVNPSYPQMARAAHVYGMVMVFVEVDENGVVKTVQRTSGPQLLRQAAEDAARRWKFRPTVVDGQPVRVTGFLTFNFTL